VARLVEDLHTIVMAQAEVADDDVERLAAKELDGLAGIGERGDVDLLGREPGDDALDKSEDLDDVVDDKEPERSAQWLR
jgi:hypothetical protein